MPPDRGQAGQALERACGAALERPGAQRQVLGEHDGRCVYWLSGLAQATSGQASDRDFGQCLHPHSQEHCAIDTMARQARCHSLFFTTLQPCSSIALSGCGTRSNTRGWPSSAERPKNWRPMWGIFWRTLGRRTSLIFMAVDLLVTAYNKRLFNNLLHNPFYSIQ